MKFDPESLEAYRDMGHVLGQVRNSTHQEKVGTVKERISFSWTEETSQFQHKHKHKHKHRQRHSFGQPNLDPNCELRQTANAGKVSRLKSSVNVQDSWLLGHKSCDDDELVKHMSNLPVFLQRVEKENSIQEKALNFGVLEWKRLEKWKYTERMPGKSPKKASSSGSSFCPAGGPPKMGSDLRKQSSSHICNSGSFYSGKVPLPHGLHVSSPQRRPPPHSSHPNPSVEERNSSHHEQKKYFGPVKSKGKEVCNQELQGAQNSASGKQHDHFDQRVHLCSRSYKTNVDNSKKNHPKKKSISGKEVPSLERGKHKLSLSPPNKINTPVKKSEMPSDSKVKFTTECRPAEPRNIVLLIPQHFPKSSCSESPQFTESRTSLDEQSSEVAENRLSDFFSSRELYSGELSADTSHSCPLPSAAAVHDVCAIEPHNLATSQAIDLDVDINAWPGANSGNLITHMKCQDKYSMVHKETVRPLSFVEAFTNTQADISEQTIVSERAPSPVRRFSFNLGRMSRSFSFKESSAFTQLSSTHTTGKSGPERPKVPSGMDKFQREKEDATSSRGRSSPLRRLLDPLLKHKGAQSAEIVQPPNKSLRSMMVRTSSTNGPSQDRKPESSTFQALLHLTLKDGLPFFKLVVENSEDMLAAAVKRLPIPGKSRPCMIYAFYSVHEIRKKTANWITQGSKSKTCRLGCYDVGQMKISSFYDPKVNAGDSGECYAWECVLYGIDPERVDKQTLEFVPNKEIAAIIVNNSIKNLVQGELHGKNQLRKETHLEFASAMTVDTEENKRSNGTVVILPGGVHGMPVTGLPSSLISRWKSGGLCDCGGWDVGCKLRILSDRKETDDMCQASISSSDVNHVNLFVQGGEQESKPVFSLEPLRNGLYSVKLDSSISLLEAFAICVAHVSCWKFPEAIDTKVQFPEAITGTDKMKTPTKFQEQVPARNVSCPCPPLSPAGRI